MIQLILDTIKSLREATTEELQRIYKRYELSGAVGVAKNNEVSLHQQGIPSIEILPHKLSVKEIGELMEQAGMKYDERYNNRVKLYRASDETVDSCGDIIKQDGWDMGRFKSNPVIPYCHDYYELPIGTAIKWQVKDNALWIWKLFALKEVNPFADVVFNMVEAGMLKGCSVGFVPKKVMSVEDEDERKKLGLGKYGVIFIKQLLLESSVCPIGCNPSALVQDSIFSAVQKGVVKREEIEYIQKELPQTSEVLGVALDRVLVMLSNKAFFPVENQEPETPVVEKTPPEPAINCEKIIDSIKEHVNLLITDLGKSINESKSTIENINSKLLTIENDIASIKSEPGTGGASPELEPNTDYMDMVMDISTVVGDLHKSINKQ